MLGQASLVVYWVHIEIVYGRPFAAYSRTLAVSQAAMQLLWIMPLMILLAWGQHYGFSKVLRKGAMVCGRIILPSPKSTENVV